MSGRFPVVITTPLVGGSTSSAVRPCTSSNPTVVVENPASTAPRACDALKRTVFDATPCTCAHPRCQGHPSAVWSGRVV
eukprot:2502350-Rhodomonas_salina.3